VITVLAGGSGSGKSLMAEALAASLPPPVTFVATWIPADDPDMLARVAAHRARRPAGWAVREAGRDLVDVIRSVDGTVLVDALGTWVAGAEGFEVDVADLCEAVRSRSGDTVIVTDEVGQGVHPSSEAGRAFRDALGRVNQAVVAVADQAWLVVAGRVVPLARAPWGT